VRHPVTILLSISSLSSAYRKRCCKDKPNRFMFSPRACSSLGTHRAHIFRNFKRSCIVLYSYAKPWKQPSAAASVAMSTGWPGRASSAIFERRWEDFSTQMWTALCNKHFPPKQETLLYEYPLHWVLLPTKTHNRTSFFGSTLLKHCRHFDYWNQPLNLGMRACYLDFHEARFCCYVVIQTENSLRPLQLFYFLLWPIYWLSLVSGEWSGKEHLIDGK
jgi:hypothetical protein